MSEKTSTFQSESDSGVRARRPLYTPEERLRRDGTYWTFVQGLLAPIQFFVFLGSLGFVVRYLLTGEGLDTANDSVVIKTLVLYTIMITGCIWEKVVFGRYLFAPSFFWEDVFSMLVLALHTAYLYAMATQKLQGVELMYLALAAYATYLINAGQFLLKLRAARLDQEAKLRETSAAQRQGLQGAPA
jgi:3-vinyl bacteriochlorophyllide hydratase